MLMTRARRPLLTPAGEISATSHTEEGPEGKGPWSKGQEQGHEQGPASRAPGAAALAIPVAATNTRATGHSSLLDRGPRRWRRQRRRVGCPARLLDQPSARGLDAPLDEASCFGAG